MTDRTRISDAPQHHSPATKDNFDRTALYNGYKSLNPSTRGQQEAKELTLTNPYSHDATSTKSAPRISGDRLDNIHSWENKLDASLDKVNARIEQVSPAHPEGLINRQNVLQDKLNRLEARFPDGDTA